MSLPALELPFLAAAAICLVSACDSRPGGGRWAPGDEPRSVGVSREPTLLPGGECSGATGQIDLALPAAGSLGGLTVFAMAPDGIRSTGVPAGPPLASVVVSTIRDAGTSDRVGDSARGAVLGADSFPVGYVICAEPGDVILVAAVDATGDEEILGEGDYVGHVAVTIGSTARAAADIVIDHRIDASECKKGKAPKEKRRRRT